MRHPTDVGYTIPTPATINIYTNKCGYWVSIPLTRPIRNQARWNTVR